MPSQLLTSNRAATATARKGVVWKEVELSEVQFKAEDSKFPFGGFVGYLSTWDNVDSAGEAVKKGAFKAHGNLKWFLKQGWGAPNHDWDAPPIAMPVTAIEDDKGLYVEFAFHSHAQAQVWRSVTEERLQFGLTVKMSIGYRVLKAKFDKETGVRWLLEIKLYEGSLVNLPANDEADVTGVKAESMPDDIFELRGEPNDDGERSSLGGLKFGQHTEIVLADVKEWVERMQQITELRAKKDGVSLSTVNRNRLMQVEWSLYDMMYSCRAMLDDVYTAIGANEALAASEADGGKSNSDEADDREGKRAPQVAQPSHPRPGSQPDLNKQPEVEAKKETEATVSNGAAKTEPEAKKLSEVELEFLRLMQDELDSNLN